LKQQVTTITNCYFRKGNHICGPSSQQEGLAAQEASFSNLLQANYAQNFGAQSQVLQNLNNIFTPIAQAGPDQQGYGPQQLAALNTEIGEGVGQNYSKASQALNTQFATQGGGNEFLPTGAQAALKSQLATSAANEMSNEQLSVTNANYNQGRQNWQNATAGLGALAQEYNPNAIGGLANNANEGAFNEATNIQQMQNQKQSAIAGGIAGLAMDAATFGAGAMGGGGIQGGLTALGGGGFGGPSGPAGASASPGPYGSPSSYTGLDY
jgi:hypothetical protein